METFSFFLPAPLNESVQVGDTAYYIPIAGVSGGFNIANPTDSIQNIGIISKIQGIDSTGDGATDHYKITCGVIGNIVEPDIGDFILFSKIKQVEEAGLMGYYGEFTMSNNSPNPAELFMMGVELTTSS